MSTFSKAYIPYGGYYSTPFCRWQGTMQNENAIELGAKTARRWFLEKKKIDPTIIDYMYLGITIPQLHLFYAHNWAAGMLVDNQKNVPALFIHQACTTSATILNLTALAIRTGSLRSGLRPYDGPLFQRVPHRVAQSSGSRRRGNRRELDDGQFQRRP